MSVRKINGNYNFISENLKKIRKEKHFSQADLIRDLNLMGIAMYKNDEELKQIKELSKTMNYGVL